MSLALHNWIRVHDWVFVLDAERHGAELLPFLSDEQFYRFARPIAESIASAFDCCDPLESIDFASQVARAMLARFPALGFDEPEFLDTRVYTAVAEYHRISSGDFQG